MYVQAADVRIANSRTKAEVIFWISVGGVLLIKALSAGLFPLTGDEAYFIQWGRSLDGSYYDHGPVTGWLLWSLMQVSDSVAWIRLPAIVFSVAIAYLLVRAWRPYDRERAYMIGAVMAWSLPSVLGILITTDTPLQLLSIAAVAMAARAEETDRSWQYLAAGALLGLAFLAKYFAVLIGLGLAVWWIGFARPRNWKGLGYLLLGVAPFVAQHIYWNAHHSWTNVMFNVVTRNGSTGFRWTGPVIFLLTIGWLLGPVVVAMLRGGRARRAMRFRAAWARLRDSRMGIYVVTFVVPYAVLLVVSAFRPVGIHWLLSFFPLCFGVLMIVFRSINLHRLLSRVMWFSFAHLALGLLLTVLPMEWARDHRSYVSIVSGMRPAELLRAIAPYRGHTGDELATPSYARSALLEFHAGQPVRVLGVGSHHGRQDDIRTDWSVMNGKDFTYVTANLHDLDRVKLWFEHVSAHTVDVRGATFHVFAGKNFNYQAYRSQVLAPIAERYYSKPAWLEPITANCFFRERYGFENGR